MAWDYTEKAARLSVSRETGGEGGRVLKAEPDVLAMRGGRIRENTDGGDYWGRKETPNRKTLGHSRE
jgi:hypothetical protein